MKLRELASLLLLSTLQGDGETDIQGIETDSRKVKPGDLFLCLPGFRTDGHQFAEAAVKQGAVALLVERDVPVEVPKLFVKDAHFASALIATHFYNHPTDDLKVIGITGTNGKTTTTYLLEHIFRDYGLQSGVVGTVGMKIGNEIVESANTTPQATELQRAFRRMKDVGAKYAMIEVSSHSLHHGRVRGCDFHTAIFTNLTQDHLDFHGTMQEYRNAKGLLFAQLGNRYASQPEFNKYAVLNIDDEASDYYRRITAAQVITYGINHEADVRATNIEITGSGTRFELNTFWGSTVVETRLIGKFNVYNMLAAIAASLIEGIPLAAIKESLATIQSVSGRFEVVDEGQDFTVIVDYAHTPDSVQNVLETVKEFAQGRIITIVGCGGDRDRTKRPIMGRIAAELSDLVIVTSDNPRSEEPQSIIEQMVAGIEQAGFSKDRYETVVDRSEAIAKAIHEAHSGDVIVIAGKGHETYQEIQGVKHDFDDRKHARAAIHQRLK